MKSCGAGPTGSVPPSVTRSNSSSPSTAFTPAGAALATAVRRTGWSRLTIAAAGLALAGGISGCSGIAYAAKVNGAVISRRDVNAELAAFAKNKTFVQLVEQQTHAVFTGSEDGTYDAPAVALILDQQIQYKLVEQELARRNVPVTDAALVTAASEITEQYTLPNTGENLLDSFPASYRTILKTRKAEFDVFTAAVGGPAPDAAAVKAAYAARSQSLAKKCIRHILYTKGPDALEKAVDARARIVAGADFAVIAKAESKDPGSGAQGGDLGCVAESDLSGYVPEFADAVRKLGVGELSQPVQTSFGQHIIQVTSAQTPPLDEVRDQLTSELTTAGQAKVKAQIDDLRLKADVRIDTRFGTWGEASSGGRGVVPPRGPEVSTSQPATSPRTSPPGVRGGAGPGADGSASDPGSPSP